MLLAAVVPIVATALGTLLAFGAGRWRWVFEPVRSFALAAVTLTIALHLMPEAVDEAGPWALAVLAGGVVLPGLIGWLRPKGTHGAVAVELSFLGVLAHQIGDGLGLGAVTGPMHAGHTHWDFFLAIGAHTIPLAAVVAITFEARDGRRAAIARGVAIALAPLIGLAATRAGSAETTAEISPWLNAAVSGLLLHLLAHDLPIASPRTGGVRSVELLAIAAGVALPLLTSHHEDVPGIAEQIPGALRALALAGAPALLVGVLVGAALHAWARRARIRWLDGGRGPLGAIRGAILGVPLPPCSCDVVPVAGELRERGAGPAFATAFVLGAPQLGLGALLVGVALLGWQLALLRLAAGLVAAILAGLVAERIARDRGRAIAPADLPPGPDSITEGVDDLIAHDGAWIAVGLTVAAFLLAAAPDLHGTRGALLALALVAPLAISATAATPIAAAAIATGLSPGVGVAAILIGSMLNLTTLGFLRRTWGLAVAVAAAFAVGAVALVVALLPLSASPIELVGEPAAIACGVAVLALAAASLWRHGLAHWLAALRGADHGHDHDHGIDEHHHHH